MTNRTLKRHIWTFVVFLLLLISLAGFAKFSHHLGYQEQWFPDVYQFIIDMSLLIFTIGAAYLANMFQRRANFVSSLREEWHEIVKAKSSIICYIDNPGRDMGDYLNASQHLSQCIDFMRICYRNVGETKLLIGKYPYEPLHDMRRSLAKIDPRRGTYSIEQLYAVRLEIWESFNALRESFLEELDLEEPAHPLIGEGARRKKQAGSK